MSNYPFALLRNASQMTKTKSTNYLEAKIRIGAMLVTIKHMAMQVVKWMDALVDSRSDISFVLAQVDANNNSVLTLTM